MTAFERFIKEQDKEQTLIALGLTEREYAPNGVGNWQYDKSDYLNGIRRYYREVAIKVSDEEYSVILEKAKAVAEIKKKRESALASKNEPAYAEDTSSKVATVLRYIVGITSVIVVITALILFGEEYTAALGGIILGAVLLEGVLLVALAEILDRLSEISYYTKRTMKNTKE